MAWSEGQVCSDLEHFAVLAMNSEFFWYELFLHGFLHLQSLV